MDTPYGGLLASTTFADVLLSLLSSLTVTLLYLSIRVKRDKSLLPFSFHSPITTVPLGAY